MIKFENTEVMNFEGAFRGMRNPLNSWDKSDSVYCWDKDTCKDCTYQFKQDTPQYKKCTEDTYILGIEDIKLAQKLIKAGSDHRKFMRQIFVSVDITAPLYWWKEFDTYKVGTVSNSCSTMHKIHAKEFTLEDFSIEHLNERGIQVLEFVIENLESYRKMYNITKNKEDWYNIIQLLPSSYNQRRTITLTYENLRNIRGSRRNHKLDEWSIGFMKWIDSLPYAEELIKI